MFRHLSRHRLQMMLPMMDAVSQPFNIGTYRTASGALLYYYNSSRGSAWRTNPQIRLLVCFFSTFSDFSKFVCGNCRYGHFNVCMF